MLSFTMRVIFLLFFITFFSSCTKLDSAEQVQVETVEVEIKTEAVNEENPEIADPLRIRSLEITASMDDRLLASHVIISGIDGRGSLPSYMIELLRRYPPGGVMLFSYNLNTVNNEIKNLLTETAVLIKNESGIPPFMAVDHEGGTVNRFFQGVADIPNASHYWDISQSIGRDEALSRLETASFNAANAISSLGINMNFAPVAEYLIDDNRSFLRYRSYGPDPFFTYQASSVFMQSMHQAGVLSVAKHFPGSAGQDPHYSASVIHIERDEFDSLILPFIMLINNGARAIMAAHTLIPSIDSKIASLSSVFMQDILRNELGFEGIIISDDFIMEAAGGINHFQAAVNSIIAGSDMILVWPGDLQRTHAAILTALKEGHLPRERLLEAVQRIIYEKLRMGLMD